MITICYQSVNKWFDLDESKPLGLQLIELGDYNIWLENKEVIIEIFLNDNFICLEVLSDKETANQHAEKIYAKINSLF